MHSLRIDLDAIDLNYSEEHELCRFDHSDCWVSTGESKGISERGLRWTITVKNNSLRGCGPFSFD